LREFASFAGSQVGVCYRRPTTLVFIRLPRRSRAKAGDRRNAFRAKWHSALIERRYSAPKAQHFTSAWGDAPGLVK